MPDGRTHNSERELMPSLAMHDENIKDAVWDELIRRIRIKNIS